MTTVDYAHTARAQQNREVKAAALAGAARRLGVPAAGLAIGGGRRRDVRTLARVASASEETWHEVVQILAADPPPAGPRPRGCDICPTPDARLYLCGWRCDAHSPAALAGRTIPVPPPGTTAAELRAARPSVQVEQDPRVVAAKAKGRDAISRAKLATEVMRARRRPPDP